MPLPSSETESFDSKTNKTLVRNTESVRSVRKFPEVPYFTQAAEL